MLIEVAIAALLGLGQQNRARYIGDVALEKLNTFLFSITYEQFVEEVNLIRRTERSNEHSTTSGLSGLEVYEWPDATEAIVVRAVAPARYALRTWLESKRHPQLRGGSSSAVQREGANEHTGGKVCARSPTGSVTAAVE